MRVIIQRVSSASVETGLKTVARISQGLLVLVGIEENDEQEDAEWLASKIARLRIFDDSSGIMNLSVSDISAQILVVSQFTLHASTKKGNRPSYIRAARPEKAIPLYEYFVQSLGRESGVPVLTGIFGAMMNVTLANDGPVTIQIDSRNKE